MSFRKTLPIAVVSLFALVGAACGGSSADTTNEAQAESVVGAVEQERPDVTLLPVNFPFPPGHEVNDVERMDTSGVETTFANATVPGSVEETVEFYQTALSASGYTITEQDADSIEFEDGSTRGSLLIAKVDDGSTVVYLTLS